MGHLFISSMPTVIRRCYKPLFELLQTEYHVFGMLLRPLWDGLEIRKKFEDWKSFFG